MLEFTTKDELFKHLKENKDVIITAKKNATKYADAVSYTLPIVPNNEDFATKEQGITNTLDTNKIVVKAVINTTNILDSHGDVHIKNIWKKSLQENKKILHLQEHQMKFDKVISKDVTATAKTMTWKSLGFDYEGSTQALIFESTISKKDYNEFMFNQYLSGEVDNHSVGMRYVKLELCINSDQKYYVEEKANWDKYIDEIVNKELAEEQGYFWAVLEAKVIEGSAVLIGSNYATPTISVTESKEADIVTSTPIQTEPTKVTQDYSKVKFI